MLQVRDADKREVMNVLRELGLGACSHIIGKVNERGAIEFTRDAKVIYNCLLYTSPSPRDRQKSRMPSSA